MEYNPKLSKRTWWQLKLRGKFISVISVILIIIFGLTAFFLVKSVRNNLTNGLNNETTAFAALATKPIGDNFVIYHESGTLLVQQQMQKFAVLDPNVSNIAVVNLAGLSQFSLTGKPINASTVSVSSFESTTVSNKKGQIVQAVEPYVDDSGQHSYAIAFEISPSRVEETIQKEGLTILILMLVGLLFSAIATYEFINFFFLQSINSLTQTARVIADGRYATRVHSSRYDEIGTLAGSIDNMADALEADISKLQELDKQKDEFIKIVSHNLRTPLTIIQSNASFMDNAQLSPIMKKMVQGIEDSARRLNLFSEQILTISEFESEQTNRAMLEEVSLSDLLGPLSREYEAYSKTTKRINFHTEVENTDAKFFTSRYQVVSAVRNLLDNALKFTPEDGSVVLTAQISAGKVYIKVSDSGIGIKKEEMPKLFTKFHRGSETLVYNYEGTGIGLYVTKLIIEQLNGKITAESRLGEGSAFTIELPYLTSGS